MHTAFFAGLMAARGLFNVSTERKTNDGGLLRVYVKMSMPGRRKDVLDLVIARYGGALIKPRVRGTLTWVLRNRTGIRRVVQDLQEHRGSLPTQLLAELDLAVQFLGTDLRGKNPDNPEYRAMLELRRDVHWQMQRMHQPVRKGG